MKEHPLNYMWLPLALIGLASVVFLLAAWNHRWQRGLNLVACGLFLVTLALIVKKVF